MTDQRKTRAALVVEPQKAAAALATQRVECGGVEARAAIAESEAMPLRFVAEPRGMDTDSEKANRFAFRVPTFVGAQMFWGNDRLTILKHVLLRKSPFSGQRRTTRLRAYFDPVPRLRRTIRAHRLGLAGVTLCTASALAMSENDLRAALEQRFKGDRTGACVAAAVIDNATTASAYFCANPKSQRPYDEHTAFEIGSVTKTMTAALLAEFIASGQVILNDPIAKLLPPGTSVPSFSGREITIGDIVTHTSGLPRLPPQWRMTDMKTHTPA